MSATEEPAGPLLEVISLGSQPGKQPAPLTQASTTAPGGASSRGYPACGAGGGEGRELLLHPLPPAMRALRPLLLARQYKFLKNLSAVGTGIFEDRHGRPCSLLRFDLTDALARLPLRGFPAARSGEPGDPGDSRQDQKPDHQKENVNQNALHALTHSAGLRMSGTLTRRQ